MILWVLAGQIRFSGNPACPEFSVDQEFFDGPFRGWNQITWNQCQDTFTQWMAVVLPLITGTPYAGPLMIDRTSVIRLFVLQNDNSLSKIPPGPTFFHWWYCTPGLNNRRLSSRMGALYKHKRGCSRRLWIGIRKWSKILHAHLSKKLWRIFRWFRW